MAVDGNIPAIDEGEDWDIASIVRAVAHKLGIPDAFESDQKPDDLLEKIGRHTPKVRHALDRHLKSWQKKKELIAGQVNPTHDSDHFARVPDGYMAACLEMDASRKDLIETVREASY